jgi:hypothetical protein
MSDTPRTDEAVDYASNFHPDCEVVNVEVAIDLERELTEAKFDLQFRRDLYALQSKELTEAREDAMDHKHMLQSLSKTQALDRAELDRSFQYVIKQRDTLAEACSKLMKVVGAPDTDEWQTIEECDAAYLAGKQALAAVKGGSNE